jgi:hypothetical protein
MVDALPYVIIFAILFLIALGVFTWTLDMWYKQYQCSIYPNIWCSDNWTCNEACPEGFTGERCFVTLGSTGLASCIYGPKAPGATVCLNPPSNPNEASCSCPTGIQVTNNCLVGCASQLGEVSNSDCCCCPNTAGCPWKSIDEVPESCNYTSGPCVNTPVS